MAHKESEQLESDERYALGGYSFRVERSAGTSPNYDKIEAICTDKDGKNARKSIQIDSRDEFVGWYVEANDTTADVYVTLKIPDEEGKTSDLSYETEGVSNPIECASSIEVTRSDQQVIKHEFISGTGMVTGYYEQGTRYYKLIYASNDPNAKLSGVLSLSNSYTHNGKTVYYSTLSGSAGMTVESISPQLCEPRSGTIKSTDEPKVAWTMVYGISVEPEEEETMLVGRFEIDLEEAGGTGEDSDWTDPGDYDEDSDPDDPTTTLYLNVTGALSGRHNDPLNDTSYSYVPADNQTQKDYGCGGDGGYGGGGGGGASTVVIYKFATSKADSKELTALARRHGYGSGGGKGGKGGDGCILIYY